MNALHRLALAPLSASPVFAAAMLLLAFLLAMDVSRLRLRHKVFLGDGGHKELALAIRRHLNSIEHAVPLALLLVIFELQGGDHTRVLLLGWLALGGRLLHAVGFGRARVASTSAAALTYAAEVALPLSVIARALR